MRGDMKKNKESPTFVENMSSYFSQFCGATSIHGMQYLGERGRFVLEKLIWTVIITGVSYFCVFLIFKAYKKWESSPVIVTFSTTEMPVWDIEFPAVTLCPQVKTHPDVFNFTDVIIKKISEMYLTPEEEDTLESMSLICYGGLVTDLFKNIYTNPTVSDDKILLLKYLIYSSPDHKEGQLLWLRNNDTDDLVSGIFTEDGLCRSFNMLDTTEILRNPEEFFTQSTTKPHKWLLEKGYSDNYSTDPFPKRTFVSGLNGGVLFTMPTKDSHLDYLCGSAVQGFKVMLHRPWELPDMAHHFLVPLDQAVYVGIKPKMMTVSAELRSYKPEDRNCYFSNEKHLKYFKHYSQNNCLQECLSNYTLSNCGCLGFYMPKDAETPNCGSAKKDCIENSSAHYLSNLNDNKENNCNCLPSCISLEYEVETSQAPWEWRKEFEVLDRIRGTNFTKLLNDHFSLLAVYFKEMQFITSERHELYNYVDFFANTGGLLGLFIGFSVTSLIEIIYFLTLRLACNISKFGKRFWSGEPDLISTENEQQNELL